MKNIILIVTFFFVCSISGQTNVFTKDPILILDCGVVDNKLVKLSDVTLKVFVLDSLVGTFNSDSSGKFRSLEPKVNSSFILEFSKDKYVTKTIQVDTYISIPEDSIKTLAVFPCDVRMIKSKKRKDYSIITSKPVALIKFDEETKEFDYDRVYIANRSKEIDAFYNKKKR